MKIDHVESFSDGDVKKETKIEDKEHLSASLINVHKQTFSLDESDFKNETAQEQLAKV